MWGGDSCPDSRLFQPFHILAGKKKSKTGQEMVTKPAESRLIDVK